jgi:hypothetical protein
MQNILNKYPKAPFESNVEGSPADMGEHMDPILINVLPRDQCDLCSTINNHKFMSFLVSKWHSSHGLLQCSLSYQLNSKYQQLSWLDKLESLKQ